MVSALIFLAVAFAAFVTGYTVGADRQARHTREIQDRYEAILAGRKPKVSGTGQWTVVNPTDQDAGVIYKGESYPVRPGETITLRP